MDGRAELGGCVGLGRYRRIGQAFKERFPFKRATAVGDSTRGRGTGIFRISAVTAAIATFMASTVKWQ